MQQKIRVGAVSYLNTKPLIYGFEQGMMKDELELLVDYPSRIADMLLHDGIDAGLVPVAVIPLLSEYHIISQYCIASAGEVGSVCLFSDVPLHQVETILLDYQSATSVQMLRILLQEHWKIFPKLLPASPGYEKNIKGATAGLVIGDRAFAQKKSSACCFDLGSAWQEFAGRPFVYAAWVSNKKLEENIVAAFDSATGFGLGCIDKVISENPCDGYDLAHYFSHNILYRPGGNLEELIGFFLQKSAGIISAA